ncbi:hypothetical protein [Coleofasciculus sp. F4-SAH-05]|uniref:hypothetical protein n=1 Tax=Coleofasciculus sp. F4-SAH-05 TaxID=3069525 RepID=UPI0033030C95
MSDKGLENRGGVVGSYGLQRLPIEGVIDFPATLQGLSVMDKDGRMVNVIDDVLGGREFKGRVTNGCSCSDRTETVRASSPLSRNPTDEWWSQNHNRRYIIGIRSVYSGANWQIRVPLVKK